MEIFIHLSQSSKEPSQDSFGTGIPLLQDRLHTASCTKGTGFSLWDSSKLQFSYDRLFLSPLVNQSQHVEAEGLVHVGHLREGNVLGRVAHGVEVPRGHRHHFRAYTTGCTIEAEGTVAQGVLVNALVHDRLYEVMEMLQQFPQADAVEVTRDGDETCFRKGALRGVAGEDFIGKTSFAEEFEFVDNGIDHLFLKVIAVNIGSSEPHEAGEGLLGVLPIAMMSAFQLVLQDLRLVYVETADLGIMATGRTGACVLLAVLGLQQFQVFLIQEVVIACLGKAKDLILGGIVHQNHMVCSPWIGRVRGLQIRRPGRDDDIF